MALIELRRRQTRMAVCEAIHKMCWYISCNLICSLCVDKYIYIHIIITIIHPEYVFAFVEKALRGVSVVDHSVDHGWEVVRSECRHLVK